MKLNIIVEEKEYTISNEGFYPFILFKRTTGKNFSGSEEDVEEYLTLIWCYLKVDKSFNYELEDFLRIATIDIINNFNKINSKQEEKKI